MPPENDGAASVLDKPGDWWKRLMFSGVRHHAGGKLTASAIIGSAISGFRFVQPVDAPSQTFRYVCLIAGAIGFIKLFMSPAPEEPKKTPPRNKPPKTVVSGSKPAPAKLPPK